MKRPYDLHALSRALWPETDILAEPVLYCARIEALGDMVTGRERRPYALTSYERTLIRRFLSADDATYRQSLVVANEESTG